MQRKNENEKIFKYEQSIQKGKKTFVRLWQFWEEPNSKL